MKKSIKPREHTYETLHKFVQSLKDMPISAKCWLYQIKSKQNIKNKKKLKNEANGYTKCLKKCMFSLSQTAANAHAVTENQQLNTHLLKRISVLLFSADTNMAFHRVLLISDELEFSVIVQGKLTEKRIKEKQTKNKTYLLSSVL